MKPKGHFEINWPLGGLNCLSIIKNKLAQVGMPIPLQEMILGESGDRGKGKGEFSAYSSGFGVGE